MLLSQGVIKSASEVQEVQISDCTDPGPDGVVFDCYGAAATRITFTLKIEEETIQSKLEEEVINTRNLDSSARVVINDSDVVNFEKTFSEKLISDIETAVQNLDAADDNDSDISILENFKELN